MRIKFLKINIFSIIGWIVVFIVLFSYLQLKGLYNLYFMEQWQIFLYDWTYIAAKVWQPGGFTELLSDFLVQFFAYPFYGAIVFAILLTLTGLFTNLVLRQLAPEFNLSVISILPVISLLFLQFNINYHLSGTIAFLLFLIALNTYLRMRSFLSQVLFASCSALALFLLGGSIASLFVISVLLIELFIRIQRSYIFLVPSAIVCLSAFVCLRIGVTGELKYLLLPDGYFNPLLKAGNIIFQPWVIIIGILLFALLLKWVDIKKKNILIVAIVIQSIVLGWFAIISLSSMKGSRYELFKELDYYMRTENWNKILQRCKEIDMNNYLFQNCQNVALAEKGELAETLFNYPQQGLQSIYLNWDNTPYISVLLSDVYFSMGHIALSQRMAFESNVSGNNYNPRMLKRLIQTNIIYGAYKVAEKYITILEKTKYYSNWAHSQRNFLYNDRAVENDRLLGNKRKCLFPEDCLSGKNGIDFDLKLIIDHNPLHQATIQYLGSIYLLIKDMPEFKSMIERYYGTRALPNLPKSYQEGMMLYAADDSTVIKQYHINDMVVREYKEFRNKKTSAPGTYWNYMLHYNGN
jgi:hypothetical protein